MQRKFGFILKPGRVSFILQCFNGTFHDRVHHGTIFWHFSSHGFISDYIPEQQLCVPCTMEELSQHWRYIVCTSVLQGLPLTLYDLLVLHVRVRSVGPSRPKLKITSWWSVHSSAPYRTRTSNTDRNKSAKTMQKQMSDPWPNESLHQV